MATDPPEPTPPEPARPLSPREQATLAELAAATRREDPDWSASLAGPSSVRPRDLLIQVLVVAVLAVLLLPTAWLGALVVAIVMIGPCAVALWAMRRDMI